MSALIIICLNVKFDFSGPWLPYCPDAAMPGFAGPLSFLMSMFSLVLFAHLPADQSLPSAAEQKEVYIEWIREYFLFFFDFLFFLVFFLGHCHSQFGHVVLPDKTVPK